MASLLDVMTPMGLKFRASVPIVLRDDPDNLAVWHALAKETERLEARIELIRDQFFPQLATVGLRIWEALLKLPIEPAGLDYADRRVVVMARLLSLAGSSEGRAWIAKVSRLIGPGWDYLEHIPGDPTSPPEGTVRILVPFPPASTRYAQLESLLRVITPAHLDIVLVSSGGFLLDQSQMDQEGLGI